MRTPGKTVSFDDGIAPVRRRSAGELKPWHLNNYSNTPHTKGLYQKGRQRYRELIITKNAWPTPDSRARFGRAAWDEVIKENPELYANCELTFFSTYFRLPARLGSHKTFNNWVLRLVRSLNAHSMIVF